jgi:hypothetical protein
VSAFAAGRLSGEPGAGSQELTKPRRGWRARASVAAKWSKSRTTSRRSGVRLCMTWRCGLSGARPVLCQLRSCLRTATARASPPLTWCFTWTVGPGCAAATARTTAGARRAPARRSGQALGATSPNSITAAERCPQGRFGRHRRSAELGARLGTTHGHEWAAARTANQRAASEDTVFHSFIRECFHPEPTPYARTSPSPRSISVHRSPPPHGARGGGHACSAAN